MSVILPFPDDENHIIVFSYPCYNPIMSKRIDHLDVICQISHDGTVIPLRIRTMDDEGELQTYNIKEYRQINHDSQIVKDDGISITHHTLVFDCRIQVFDQLRPVRLYFKTEGATWFIMV